MYSEHEILASMRRRANELRLLIREKKRAVEKAPPGVVYVKNNNGYTQYYLRTRPDDRNGRYLRKSERDTAAVFMQKRYDSQVLEAAERELRQIEQFLSGYFPGYGLALYERMDPGSRKYVTPLEETDEEYAARWLSQKYDALEFRSSEPEYYAVNGLRARSKSEVLIADMLVSKNLPFLYERPVRLNGLTVHPDFTILDVERRREILWEHLGMMDDREYSRGAMVKIRDYQRAGYFPGQNLMLTFECSSVPLNIRDAAIELEKMME